MIRDDLKTCHRCILVRLYSIWMSVLHKTKTQKLNSNKSYWKLNGSRRFRMALSHATQITIENKRLENLNDFDEAHFIHGKCNLRMQEDLDGKWSFKARYFNRPEPEPNNRLLIIRHKTSSITNFHKKAFVHMKMIEFSTPLFTSNAFVLHILLAE